MTTQPVRPALAVALAAALLWASSRLTWVQVSSSDEFGPARTDKVLGGTWFGPLLPLALVLLAAVAAVFATRGGLRQTIGVVIALIGGAIAVPSLALMTHSGVTPARAKAIAGLPGRAQVTAVHISTFPGALAFVGALLAFGAGVWLARRPSKTGLSGKYAAPAARRAEATKRVAEEADGKALPERVLWDAFDAGEDPTAEDDHPRTGDGEERGSKP